MQSPAAARRGLTFKGILFLSSGDSSGRLIGPMDRIMQASLLSRFVSQTLVVLDVKRSRFDQDSLAALIDAGALCPIVERTVSLAEVADAIRHVEPGHAQGKVVISGIARRRPLAPSDRTLLTRRLR